MSSSRSGRPRSLQTIKLDFGKSRESKQASKQASIEVVSRDRPSHSNGKGSIQGLRSAAGSVKTDNEIVRSSKRQADVDQPHLEALDVLTPIEGITEAIQILSVKGSFDGVNYKETKATTREWPQPVDLVPPLPSPSPKCTEAVSKPPAVDSQMPKGVRNLLKCCNQPAVLDFDSFVATYPFDEVHGDDAGSVGFRKIGEASYSEVFAVGGVVLKIVPLLLDGQATSSSEDELPSVSPAVDVEKEILATRLVGDAHIGFIKLLE